MFVLRCIVRLLLAYCCLSTLLSYCLHCLSVCLILKTWCTVELPLSNRCSSLPLIAFPYLILPHLSLSSGVFLSHADLSSLLYILTSIEKDRPRVVLRGLPADRNTAGLPLCCMMYLGECVWRGAWCCMTCRGNFPSSVVASLVGEHSHGASTPRRHATQCPGKGWGQARKARGRWGWQGKYLWE